MDDLNWMTLWLFQSSFLISDVMMPLIEVYRSVQVALFSHQSLSRDTGNLAFDSRLLFFLPGISAIHLSLTNMLRKRWTDGLAFPMRKDTKWPFHNVYSPIYFEGMLFANSVAPVLTRSQSFGLSGCGLRSLMSTSPRSNRWLPCSYRTYALCLWWLDTSCLGFGRGKINAGGTG